MSNGSGELRQLWIIQTNLNGTYGAHTLSMCAYSVRISRAKTSSVNYGRMRPKAITHRCRAAPRHRDQRLKKASDKPSVNRCSGARAFALASSLNRGFSRAWLPANRVLSPSGLGTRASHHLPGRGLHPLSHPSDWPNSPLGTSLHARGIP